MSTELAEFKYVTGNFVKKNWIGLKVDHIKPIMKAVKNANDGVEIPEGYHRSECKHDLHITAFYNTTPDEFDKVAPLLEDFAASGFGATVTVGVVSRPAKPSLTPITDGHNSYAVLIPMSIPDLEKFHEEKLQPLVKNWTNRFPSKEHPSGFAPHTTGFYLEANTKSTPPLSDLIAMEVKHKKKKSVCEAASSSCCVM